MKPQIGFFFTELLGPSLIINLAHLVSPSVALPAELVFMSGGNVLRRGKSFNPSTDMFC